MEGVQEARKDGRQRGKERVWEEKKEKLLEIEVGRDVYGRKEEKK